MTSGTIYCRRDQIHEALTRCLETLDKDPLLHAGDRWTYWMLLGEFERAWEESDRLGASFGDRNPLEAEHLLIRCLRGFGDAIQFLRYIEYVRRRCKRVTVQAPPRLVPLLRRATKIERVVSWEDLTIGGYNCSLECSDLPYLFRSQLGTIPRTLSFDGIRAKQSHASEQLRVGVTWTAGAWNPTRALPFEALEPLWSLKEFAFISLEQRTEGAILPSLRQTTWDSELVRTAERISMLDLVITVDTMIAHLAGTIGTPVWLMLTFASDWRWMLDRTDSPWYPSMRLFRQPRPGDWPSVIHAVAHRLYQMSRDTESR